MRHAYQLLTPSSSKAVLIHYTGDENTAVNFNHRNSVKHLTRPHVRTCPSVLRSLENKRKHTTTAKVYRSHITQVPPPTHASVLQPCNKKQVKNARSKMLKKQRLSHVSLYNLHELATDMPDFVQAIHTHPDLVDVCAHKALLEELDRVLLVQSSPQLLSYDTTFQH